MQIYLRLKLVILRHIVTSTGLTFKVTVGDDTLRVSECLSEQHPWPEVSPPPSPGRPSSLSTYSASPFLCSPRWSHSHRHRRRALSVPFRRTLDRWGSRTRGSVRCNRHSIGRSGLRGAWSLRSSACTGLRIASQLVLGLRADQHISLLWYRVCCDQTICAVVIQRQGR